MVTKQQQLEWLVDTFDMWPNINSCAIKMSVKSIGCEALLDGECHTITRQEWQQEVDKMSSKPATDNSWYERGELPPVGCECEIKHRCWCGFERFTVVAITKEYVIVEDDSIVAREQHYHLRDVTFRPLRTEREKAIDSLAASIGAEFKFEGYDLHTRITRSLSEFIYDSGYRKVKP